MSQLKEIDSSYWDTVLTREGMPSELERVGILPPDLQHKIALAKAAYTECHGENVTHISQIIKSIGRISLKQSAAMWQYGIEVALDAVDSREVLSDREDPFIVVAESDLTYRVHEALRSPAIDDREATILAMRHGVVNGKPMTLQAIGIPYGIDRERVRQIEAKAARKLRRSEPSLRIFISDSE